MVRLTYVGNARGRPHSASRLLRVLMVLALIAMMAPAFMPAQPARAATTHYVADTGEANDDGACTEDEPCATIKYAIEQAQAGDTIRVSSGEYDEAVEIPADKEGLKLLGANAGKSAGLGGTERTAESHVAGFTIAADNVTIDGFQIDDGHAVHGTTAGIYVTGDTTGHVLANNRLIGPGAEDNIFGILLGLNVTDVTIQNNEARRWQSGIYLNPSRDLNIEGNHLHGNTVGIGSDGISNVSITGNNLASNTVEGFGASTVGENVTARFNRIVGNGTGIHHYSGEQISATNNWWGCNTGPQTANCDDVQGSVSFNPWLVLSVSADPDAVEVDDEATVTAALTTNSLDQTPSGGSVPDGIQVTFSVTSTPANVGSIGAANPPMEAGEATTTFTAQQSGTATVSASVDSAKESVEIEVATPAPVVTDIALSISDTSPTVGTEVTLTATVTDEDENPVANVQVLFLVSGANERTRMATTNAAGEATFRYTGNTAGDDSVTAVADLNKNGVIDSGEPRARVILGWVEPGEPQVDLTASTTEPTVGSEVDLTARVTDGDGGPIADVDVLFTVTGVNETGATVTTSGSGEATFSYSSSVDGEDTVTATADLNGNGVADDDEPQATVILTWTDPGPPAGRLPAAEPTDPMPAPHCRYFPETGHNLCAGFRAYWDHFGGLATFGMPVTEEFVEDGVVTQYFERARFEWHPGAWPEQFDVLLGLLGNEVTEGRASEAPFQRTTANPAGSCVYFPETGHNLCGGFRAYWETFGGLPIYGYPISEEFVEENPDTGELYTVQYFERARFEWHPGEFPPRFDVLLGRLGAWVLHLRHGAPY